MGTGVGIGWQPRDKQNMHLVICKEKFTHGADQDDTLHLWPLVLQQSRQQLHPRPTHMEVKFLKNKTKKTTINRQAINHINVRTNSSGNRKEVQYLQKGEEKSHVFWVLNELVCKLGTKIIDLLLSVLICEDS